MSHRLIALCFGNFIIGTGTLIVPGMLPALAGGLGVSIPVAGQLITVFAVTIAFTAPVLSAFTTRFDRRNLIVAVQLLYFVGHLAAALVTSHGQLMAVRAVSSISSGLYVAQAAAIATLLSPPEQRGRAIAFVFLGWSIASLVGLPLGAWIGAVLGWRIGFGLVAAGALASALWLRFALPGGLKVTAMSLSMWRELLRHPAILPVVAVTAFSTAAQFTLFSFFVPAAQALVGANPTQVSLLIACYGLSGVMGNAVAGRLSDRHGPARVVMVALALMLAAQMLWPWTHDLMLLLGLSMFVMGMGGFASNSAQQVRLAVLSPTLAPVSIACNSSAIYVGQAVGTVLASGLLAALPGVSGYLALGWGGSALLVAAMLVSAWAGRRSAKAPV